ncbi:MAG: peptidylprolyl isomerase [Rhodospirillales bacterium]|nr:peptidylprolyl isomerase [Rhodospirillales bacterium]
MPAAVAEPEMKEGNPVVATLGTENITRDDVAKFIAQLPVQMRQQPFEVLFPIALEQTINAKILEREADKSGIAKEPQVEEMVADAAKNIVRTAYVQKLIDDGVTDDAIKAEYGKYVASFKGEEETHARHILVATEDEAKEIIQKLADGAAFEALAKEYSTGPSGPNGGDLGYFAKEQMVPEFSNAAFALKIGDYTKEPVKTQFGYHVIKVEDRRESQPATLEEARPYIEAELKRNYLDDKLQGWRQTLEIKTFDINGEPLKQETPSPAAAAAAGHQG